MTFSDREVLRGMDFEKMSLDEIGARQARDRAAAPADAGSPTRRFPPDRRGARADMRATLRGRAARRRA